MPSSIYWFLELGLPKIDPLCEWKPFPSPGDLRDPGIEPEKPTVHKTNSWCEWKEGPGIQAGRWFSQWRLPVGSDTSWVRRASEMQGGFQTCIQARKVAAWAGTLCSSMAGHVVLLECDVWDEGGHRPWAMRRPRVSSLDSGRPLLGLRVRWAREAEGRGGQT